LSGLHPVCARKAHVDSFKVSDHETPSKQGSARSYYYLDTPKSFMCCGLLAALSEISRVPWYLPRLCGANSTEIVQVPPFGAIARHVFAVTLNGGVAAGAVVNEIGAGLSLTTVMVCGELTASADVCSKLSDLGLVVILGARPLPFSLIARTPNWASLFNCNRPFCFPLAAGANATSIVHEPPGCITVGHVLEVTTNPGLAASDNVTDADAAVFTTVIFEDLPWCPTIWSAKKIDVGFALSVAKTGLGDAVGTGVPVGMGEAVAAWPGNSAPEMTATRAAAPSIKLRNDRPVTFPLNVNAPCERILLTSVQCVYGLKTVTRRIAGCARMR
jgi:hypothetical protein